MERAEIPKREISSISKETESEKGKSTNKKLRDFVALGSLLLTLGREPSLKTSELYAQVTETPRQEEIIKQGKEERQKEFEAFLEERPEVREWWKKFLKSFNEEVVKVERAVHYELLKGTEEIITDKEEYQTLLQNLLKLRRLLPEIIPALCELNNIKTNPEIIKRIISTNRINLGVVKEGLKSGEIKINMSSHLAETEEKKIYGVITLFLDRELSSSLLKLDNEEQIKNAFTHELIHILLQSPSSLLAKRRWVEAGTFLGMKVLQEQDVPPEEGYQKDPKKLFEGITSLLELEVEKQLSIPHYLSHPLDDPYEQKERSAIIFAAADRETLLKWYTGIIDNEKFLEHFSHLFAASNEEEHIDIMKNYLQEFLWGLKEENIKKLPLDQQERLINRTHAFFVEQMLKLLFLRGEPNQEPTEEEMLKFLERSSPAFKDTYFYQELRNTAFLTFLRTKGLNEHIQYFESFILSEEFKHWSPEAQQRMQETIKKYKETLNKLLSKMKTKIP